MIPHGERRMMSPRGMILFRVVGTDTQHADILFQPAGETLSVAIKTTDSILMQGVSDIIHATGDADLRDSLACLAEWIADWHGKEVHESFTDAIRNAKPE